MADREWLQSLKTGDEISVDKPFGLPSVTGEVVRTTQNRVVVKCNPWGYGMVSCMFRKDDGCGIPYLRDGLRISPPKGEGR